MGGSLSSLSEVTNAELEVSDSDAGSRLTILNHSICKEGEYLDFVGFLIFSV